MGSNVHAAEKLNTFICNFITLSTKPLLKVKYYVRKYMPFISFTSCWEKEKKKKSNKRNTYKSINIIKYLPLAVSTAHLICLRNLGLKVTPGFSLTLHVTARRIAVVMPQPVGDGRCCAEHHLHAAFGNESWDLGAQPCSLPLRYGNSLWEVMEVRLERKRMASYKRSKQSDFWKECGKLTGSLSDLKSSREPPFLGSNWMGLKHTWKSTYRNAPASSG